MTIHPPSKYLDYIAYCNKRKHFCKDYRNAKIRLFKGDLHLEDYFKILHNIKRAAIELELEYFDVLHMRA